MKTVVLMRVSTDHQETKAQRSAINKYIKDNGIYIDEWLEEKDVSGFKVPIDKRKALNKIKEYAINKELDRLIVFNLDRIGRKTISLPIIFFASSDISAALSSFEDERKPAWCRFVKITDFAFFLVSFPILSMLSFSFAFLERNSFQSLKERVFSYERNF